MSEHKNINIGIDFGASSTKVAISDVSKGVGADRRILKIDEKANNYPDYVIPSSIRIVNGAIFFGKDAEESSNGQKDDKLKMNLSQSNCSIDLQKKASLFLAFIIQQSVKKINTLYEGYDISFMVNLGAPLKDIDSGNIIEKTYSKILNTAWNLALNNKIEFSQGMNIIDFELIDNADNVELYIIPECHGAITTFASHKITGIAEYYITIDIGAFTTDMAFFSVGGYLNQQTSYFTTDVIFKGYQNIRQNPALIKNPLVSLFYRASDANLINISIDELPAKFKLCFMGGGAKDHCLVREIIRTLPIAVHQRGYIDISDFIKVEQTIDKMFFGVAYGLAVDKHNMRKIVIVKDPLPSKGPNIFTDGGRIDDYERVAGF